MVAWMCVVASELIAASSGIGYLIMDARQLSQTDVVLVGMITIGAMGKLLDSLLKRAEARLITWKPTFKGH
jgi:sulfonate transport system permease protein